MKKAFGILLSILMVLNVVIPVNANTTEAILSSNISVGTEVVSEVKRGDTLTLTVSMSDCDVAFKSLGLTLAYDESVFEYVETDVNGNANWSCPITGLFMSAYVAKNKNLATAAMNEIKYNGVIFTINLTIKDTATFGKQEISITPVIKNGQTLIPCLSTTSTVEVVCNHTYSDEWTSNENGHYKTCTIKGCTSKTKEQEHDWAHACDTECSVCGFTREISHQHDTTKWETDGTNHWHACTTQGCNQTTDLAKHTGGTADCKNKAVCEVCNKPYGKFGGHTLTHHVGEPADHNNTGVTEHWTCDVCGKYFSDEAGTTEIEHKDTITNKVPHDFDTEWSHDTKDHWKECDCGDKIEVAAHSFDNDCDTTCICGYTRTITHSWKATYSSNKTEHWYECDVCGEKKEVGGHTGGTATCTEKAICEVCDKEYGELAQHHYIENVEDKYMQTEATCVAKALYCKSCSVCGVANTETFEVGEIDALNHTGDTEIRDAIKATCTTNGYSGDTYCKSCGVKVKDGEVVLAGHDYGTTYATDKDNHWKECACGDVIEKEAHSMGEWRVCKEAIKTQQGSKERSCSVCGYRETEDIPALKTDSPKTGDYNNAYIWIVLFACSCMSISLVLTKKKRRL